MVFEANGSGNWLASKSQLAGFSSVVGLYPNQLLVNEALQSKSRRLSRCASGILPCVFGGWRSPLKARDK